MLLLLPRCVIFVVFLLLSGYVSDVRAEDLAGCYTSGSVAGIVIATVVVTLVMGGLALALLWYLWKQKKVDYDDTKSSEKHLVFPPMTPEKQQIGSNDYAFDNPYFKDDETDTANPDAAEKGESGYRSDNGGITTPPNAQTSNGTTGNQHSKKSRPFSSLPFHSVFHPSGKKQQQQQKATVDDINISKHLERIIVPLRGHDFTGLGFNVCGNMRDGIFVKDVLHRGPASESGKIKAGDRIVGVTVSFGSMVYEDALTILSYASPYDVKVEIEKASSTHTILPPSSPKRIGTSTSFRGKGQRILFHPLYRSQSIDDLTKIGKDGFETSNTSGSQRESSSSATPKRSQSVEASNGGLKTRAPIVLKTDGSKTSSNKGSRKSSTSSCGSTAKTVTPTEKTQPAITPDEIPCVKKEARSARFRAEQVNVKTEAPPRTAPPLKPSRELSEEKVEITNENLEETSTKQTNGVVVDESLITETAAADASSGADTDQDTEKPTAPPRKINTPKRKAPAPPPVSNGKMTETNVVVHRVETSTQQKSEVTEGTVSTSIANTAEAVPPAVGSQLQSEPPELTQAANKNAELTTNATPAASKSTPVLLFSSEEKIQDPGMGSSDNSSLASADHSPPKVEKDEQNGSPGKRKASSLGDLTTLEKGANKKSSISSAILERAVSLDLQQSLPEENLTKQKKILHAPTFEDEEDVDESSELNGPSLKRWDNGLDQVFIKLPNGEVEPTSHTKNDVEVDEKTDKVRLEVPELDAKVAVNHSAVVENLDSDPIADSSTEKPVVELHDETPIGELPSLDLQDDSPSTIITSTPVKKLIEVKNFKIDDDDEMDDIPYLATSKEENNNDTTFSKHSTKSISGGSTTIFSPVTISIPVIKPDLTHFEKLPSPPPASTHPGLDQSWRITKSMTSDENGKTSLERISVQSLYKPIFTSKEISNVDDVILQTNVTEKMVNGNESDASEHYSTAQENTSTSSVETSTFSVTLSNPVTKEVTVKAPSTIAGFAKTLIIPSPDDVENLLSLAAEPNTPPPNFDSTTSTTTTTTVEIE